MKYHFNDLDSAYFTRFLKFYILFYFCPFPQDHLYLR